MRGISDPLRASVNVRKLPVAFAPDMLVILANKLWIDSVIHLTHKKSDRLSLGCRRPHPAANSITAITQSHVGSAGRSDVFTVPRGARRRRGGRSPGRARRCRAT